MTTITHRHEWDMGHRLPQHEGKCRRLHGHRYVAEIDVTGELQTRGSAAGMVVDFYIIKELMKTVVDNHWDHRTMLWERDGINLGATRQDVPDDDLRVPESELGIFRVPFMPTAENIAAELLRRLRSDGLNVTRVRVYETPTGWAEVRP